MKFTRSFRYAALLLAAGIVLTALVAFVLFKTDRSIRENIPYTRLTDKLSSDLELVNAHFKSLLKGNEEVNFQKEIQYPLQESKLLLQNAMSGGETDLGTFQKLTEEDVLVLFKTCLIDVENLQLAVEERWKINTDSASLAEIGDKPYLEAYDKAHQSLNAVVDYVNAKVDTDASRNALLKWLAILPVMVVFSIISFIAYRNLNSNEIALTNFKSRLEAETTRVSTLSSFVEAVSAGDYSIDIEATDELSQKLMTMRNTLSSNAEEDERRNWATTGLAQIGEILRSSGSITDLYDNIIRFVVKYTRSNQGGMFLLNEEEGSEPYLEMVACYAFERKKFIQRKVDLGQGLIGQCYQEGARIHLREIPSDYVNITSGLGGTTPNSLLVVPMKVNDKTFGVLELASFKKYEEHEIILVEKFAESIGAAVSSARINESTRLLLERTQQQAEEMRAQEEEMRQNMEELEATQEEMRRKEAHVHDLLETEKRQGEETNRILHQLKEREKVLSLTTILSEADAAGTITYVNDKLCEVSMYTREELLGKGHNIFRHPDMPPALFKLLWQTIKDNKQVFRGVVKNRAKDGTHYWVDAVILPVVENGNFVKYVSARYHIKDDTLALQLYNKQAVQLGLPLLS